VGLGEGDEKPKTSKGGIPSPAGEGLGVRAMTLHKSLSSTVIFLEQPYSCVATLKTGRALVAHVIQEGVLVSFSTQSPRSTLFAFIEAWLALP